MKKRFIWETNPVALKENMISGKNYRFTFLTSRLIRMEYSESGAFEDRASQGVFYRNLPKTDFSVKNENGIITAETKDIVLTYVENSEFCADTLSLKLKTEPASTWHFGEDFEDLGGTVQTLDTVNGAIPLGRGVCSRNGFSVIDDSNTMLLNEAGWVEVREKNAIDCYFFGYGFDYLSAVKDYYRITGVPSLLPAYALGNWWSRYHKYTQDEYIGLMDRFKAEGVPFSVSVVDMDWHITELPDDLIAALDKEYCDMSTGWTGYTWNEKLFPDYKAFLRELKKRNLKTALNLHPAQGVRKHEKAFAQMAKAMGVDTEKENVVPFDILSRRYMENYFDILHHPYEEDGVDFWWMDYQQGLDYHWVHKKNDTSERDEREVLNPLWLLNHLHILDIARNGKRPMFFSRYCGVGAQRYPVGFSGDTLISWRSLKFQPYFTATASNIGYTWWSHDIGGHMGGFRDAELTTRWVQYGVFAPINRLHSQDCDFVRKEPWYYGSEYSEILKNQLRLRHELFPYIYTMNYRNHKELEPITQPMYYSYPKCSAAYEVPNQYFFGSEIMVAPITTPCDEYDKLGEVNAWMPKGDWFDFFTGVHYYSEKGRKIELFRDIKTIPVLAKAGAIVPMAIREPGDNRLTFAENMRINVFPGASNEFNMYEDSGDGLDYQDGAYSITKMELNWGEIPVFKINPASNREFVPEQRNWTVSFKGFNRSVNFEIKVNGVPYMAEKQYGQISEMSVSITAKTSDLIEIAVIGDELIYDNACSVDNCFDILQNARISMVRKREVMSIIKNKDMSIHRKMVAISDCSREEQHMANAIKEQLILTENEF